MMMVKAATVICRWAFIGFLLLSFLVSCTKKPDPVPSWAYGSKGIEITYTADKRLNTYDNKSHTLLLVIYQLDNVNAFNKFSAYKEGLEKLLAAQNFDASVMGIDKVFVEPGDQKTMVLDRAEKAKWIGIVAGYYNLVPGKANRTFEFTFDVHTSGWIRRKKEAQVKKLSVNLLLGPNGIQEIKKP